MEQNSRRCRVRFPVAQCPTRRAALLGVVLCLTPAALHGASALAADDAPVVRLDGDVSEWPPGAQILTTPSSVYVRAQLSEPTSIQSDRTTTALQLDLDGDHQTGRTVEIESGFGAMALGVDLEILLSPPLPRRAGRLGNGVRVLAHTPDAQGDEIGHSAVGFMFQPTHASDVYEFRLDRSELASLDLPVEPSLIRGRIVRRAADGRVLWSETLTRAAPAHDPPRSDAVEALARRGGSLRVMTLNVLWLSPERSPAPFARIIRAADPDVLLIQEWDRRDRDAERITGAAIERWFNTHVPSEQGWSAATGAGLGVAIAVRGGEIQRLEPSELTVSIGDGDEQIEDRVLRAATARIETPIGPAVVTTVHLKCCGGAWRLEDHIRMVEATAINRSLRRTYAAHPEAIRIVGGDMNLVGDPEPLRWIAMGLDRDGSALQPVDARRLGDEATITWRDERSRFTPARLDYALIERSMVNAVRSFALDTRTLTDEELEALGLERGDSAATDHLPVIVDLVRRSAP